MNKTLYNLSIAFTFSVKFQFSCNRKKISDYVRDIVVLEWLDNSI